MFKAELKKIRDLQEIRRSLSTPEAITRITNGRVSLQQVKKCIFLHDKDKKEDENIRWYDIKREE